MRHAEHMELIKKFSELLKIDFVFKMTLKMKKCYKLAKVDLKISF